VGESEANIRSVFDKAREAAKTCSRKDCSGAAILFFDEIDSLAPRRGELGDGGGVMERAVSTLLGEMDKIVSDDSIDGNSGQVFVIAATNRPDLLDASLLRPGRFDRAIYLGLARERLDRIQILVAQIRKFQFENGQDPVSIASKVVDSIPDTLSGADFSGIASGALMLALQRTCEEADMEAEAMGKTLDEILTKWSKEKLIPIVRVDDFVTAAKEVHPSVNSADLSRYDTMRMEFCSPRTNSFN
jgi:ATPases of the AAA+ class